ncbi:MAG: circularly permuted type 2 ATP-grasp protein [Betaproteobacteria bacterium]|nr:circularly permuted type 2 ATP-grasp protein [Betaproteobacteria bacterium]
MSYSAYFNEMYRGDGTVRPHYREVESWIHNTPGERIQRMREAANILFHRVGITFAVYGEEAGAERLIPFDMLPHIIPGEEWRALERGLRQRVRALNAFLHDVYHGKEILRAGRIPEERVLRNKFFRPEMDGIDVPNGIYAHIAGIDLVRAGAGEYYVLEDNLRTPSGVSYMLEDRKMMMRLMPELFSRQSIAPVEHYPDLLLDTLRSVAPPQVESPVVVLLTPGHFNSAYFEHAFLAQQMSIELVEGPDLFVEDDTVYMRTTRGPTRVDVIYRRIDDDFIDPRAFRPDSVLGVPGVVNAYRKGRVTLCNAIGTGIADDKSIYPFVPDMIRFYLGEEPLLNNVPTYQLRNREDLEYTLAHLAELVVKEVHGSGGYGMLIGPASTDREREAYKLRIMDSPESFIAQPTLSLSTCPVFVDQGIAPRHIDLRPFVLSGKEIVMCPGGLTRVALKEGSLVVNSSQGGGTKDTWVLN